jgi:hypothetical protein
MEQNINEPKMISPGLLAILIVVVLAAAGFFGWNYLQGQKSKTVAPVISPTATSSVLITDWRTCTNNKYNYDIKIPQNQSCDFECGIGATKFDQFCVKASDDKSLQIEIDQYPLGGKVEFAAVSSGDFVKLTAADYKPMDYTLPVIDKQLNDAGWVKNTQQLKMGGLGLTGYYKNSDFAYSESSTKSMDYQEIWFLVKNDVLYAVSFRYLGNKIDLNQVDSKLSLSKRILSTFQFTDSSAVSTADWKTYENKEMGFSFKYPPQWVLLDNGATNPTVYVEPDLGKDSPFRLEPNDNNPSTLEQLKAEIDEPLSVSLPNYKQNQIVFAGDNQAIQATYDGNDGTINKSIIFQNSKYLFYVKTATNVTTKLPSDSKTIDTVLGTFQFTK